MICAFLASLWAAGFCAPDVAARPLLAWHTKSRRLVPAARGHGQPAVAPDESDPVRRPTEGSGSDVSDGGLFMNRVQAV